MNEDEKNSLKIKWEEMFHVSVHYLQNSDHLTKYQNLHDNELLEHMALLHISSATATARLVQ